MSVRGMHTDLQPRACLSCAQGQANQARYCVVHEETCSFVAVVSAELNGEAVAHRHCCVAEETRSFVALLT